MNSLALLKLAPFPAFFVVVALAFLLGFVASGLLVAQLSGGSAFFLLGLSQVASLTPLFVLPVGVAVAFFVGAFAFFLLHPGG